MRDIDEDAPATSARGGHGQPDGPATPSERVVVFVLGVAGAVAALFLAMPLLLFKSTEVVVDVWLLYAAAMGAGAGFLAAFSFTTLRWTLTGRSTTWRTYALFAVVVAMLLETAYVLAPPTGGVDLGWSRQVLHAG